MKNLLKKFTIEEIEEMPIEKLGFFPSRGWWNDYKWKRYGYTQIGDYTCYTIIDRIIKEFIGKSFNDAFSKYCKIAPKHLRSYFKRDFNGNYPYYYIDDEGCIQYIKEQNQYKGPYIFKSDDILYGKIHKQYKINRNEYQIATKKVWKEYSSAFIKRTNIQGHWVSEEIRENPNIYYSSFLLVHKKRPFHYAKESDFESYIVQGWEKSFKSKKDSEYIRLKTEKAKQRKMSRKQYKKLAKEKSYSFISETEEQKKKEKLENDIKIQKHGFDLVTSFRTPKTT